MMKEGVPGADQRMRVMARGCLANDLVPAPNAGKAVCVPGAAQRETVRCRPGTPVLLPTGTPGQRRITSLTLVLHRARGTPPRPRSLR